MSKAIQNNSSIDFSSYNTVFCDSLQALEWAYQSGLPESTIIKSSSPAMLWDKKTNIHNVESRWTTNETEKFQSTIQKLTEDIFDKVMNIAGIERELALVASSSIYQFQKVIYKAACLNKNDFTDSRLFIYVDGKTGPAGNIMNSPWDKLLSSNPLFLVTNYTLKNDKWSMLTTHGVSYWRRYKIAGYETIIYRLAIKLMKRLPDWLFSKKLFVPNENELNIEISSSLALHGVKITELSLDKPLSNIKNTVFDENIAALYKVVVPIMQKRVEQWVVPSVILPKINTQ